MFGPRGQVSLCLKPPARHDLGLKGEETVGTEKSEKCRRKIGDVLAHHAPLSAPDYPTIILLFCCKILPLVWSLSYVPQTHTTLFTYAYSVDANIGPWKISNLEWLSLWPGQKLISNLTEKFLPSTSFFGLIGLSWPLLLSIAILWRTLLLIAA